MSDNEHDNNAIVSRSFEPDPEIRVWALNEKGALDFFGFSAYDKVVRVIQEGPQTLREKEKYTDKSKLFGIAPRVRTPTNDEKLTLAELLRDATLLLREARPVMSTMTAGETWLGCYHDLMKRITAATEK